MTKLLTDYKSKRLTDNVIEVLVPMREHREWSWKVRLLSDPHIDSIKSHRKYFIRSIKEASEENTGVIITGDLLDAMGGQTDPRADKSELDPLFLDGAYTDKIIDFAGDLLKPFGGSIILISQGNHESSIDKRHETDSIGRICDRINIGMPHEVFAQEYAGFVWFVFHKEGRIVDRKLYAYHHGSGLSSVSKIKERGAMLPDVDFFSYGHTHDFWSETYERHIILPNGKQYGKKELHLGIPGMKKDYGSGSGGWAVRSGHRMKPLGFWDVEFIYNRETKRVLFRAMQSP